MIPRKRKCIPFKACPYVVLRPLKIGRSFLCDKKGFLIIYFYKKKIIDGRLVGGVNMGEMYEIMILKKKIEKLQEKINRLRIARRVLMYIIEAIENEKNAKIKALTEEIYRLRKNNKRYARLLFKKNTQQS